MDNLEELSEDVALFHKPYTRPGFLKASGESEKDHGFGEVIRSLIVSVAWSLDCRCCLLMEGFSCDLPAFSNLEHNLLPRAHMETTKQELVYFLRLRPGPRAAPELSL